MAPYPSFRLDHSRSQRIVWLLEVLGLDYEIVYHQRTPSMLAPPSLQAVHPMGKAPVLEVRHPDMRGGRIVLAESALICEWLADHYGPAPNYLRPPRECSPPLVKTPLDNYSEMFLRHEWIMNWCEGTLMPTLTMSLVLDSKLYMFPCLIRACLCPSPVIFRAINRMGWGLAACCGCVCGRAR